MRSLEGDIVVGIVVVVVVVSVEMGSSTVSSSVVSACAANVDSSESPRSALHARSMSASARRGRADHRAGVQLSRGRAVAAESQFRRSRAFRSVSASGGENFRVAPLRLPVSVVRGYCWRS